VASFFVFERTPLRQLRKNSRDSRIEQRNNPGINLNSDCLMNQFALSLLLLLIFALSAHANPWPQFRGPNGSGVSSENQPLPVEIGPDKNQRWGGGPSGRRLFAGGEWGSDFSDRNSRDHEAGDARASYSGRIRCLGSLSSAEHGGANR